MKKIVILLILFLFVITAFAERNALGSILTFKENKGQVGDQNFQPRPDILFYGSAGNMNYYLRNSGISYQLNRIDSWEEISNSKRKVKNLKVAKEVTIYRLDVNWLNANGNANIVRGVSQSGIDNFYTKICPNGVVGVKSYEDVLYQNMYNGIDLKWYQKEGNLKYDYIVSPGSDYKQIQMQFDGAQKISINEKGELIIKTPLGELIEQAPIVYQNNQILPSRWVVNNNTVSFDIENINMNYSYVIDPSIRVWGTYYGGSSQDYPCASITDINNNVYMSGRTTSTDYIATTGAHQSGGGGSLFGDFLVKFNSSGVRQWATYYGIDGGGWSNYNNSCSVDLSGNVYLAGTTFDLNSPLIATPGAHQVTGGGSNTDAYLVKFDMNGVRQWGTYYGASGANDLGEGCATDVNGNVYLSGSTSSPNSISTPGSHQPVFTNNGFSAFLVKFNTNGVRQWGTYYGSSFSDGFQEMNSCVTDNNSNVYLSGVTSSGLSTFVVGGHQTSSGGGRDAYLVKFNAAGVRQWATYYGGNGSEVAVCAVTDASGNVILTGTTGSASQIATFGTHQSTIGGQSDLFLAKFNSSGIRQWGTYYGGTGSEYNDLASLRTCATDVAGNIYLVGNTNSSIGISTIGSYQPGFLGDSPFLVKLNGNGIRLWGTYYDGSGTGASSCAADLLGNAYLIGANNTITSGISTPGSHQPINNGSGDCFLVQFNESIAFDVTQTQTNITCNGSCNGMASVAAGGGTAPYTYSWSAVGATTSSVTALCPGTYTCVIKDATMASITRTFTITEPAVITSSISSQTNILCSGASTGAASLTVSGGTSPYTYSWTPTGGTAISIVSRPAGTYTCTIKDVNNCSKTQTVTITQPPAFTSSISAKTNVTCFGLSNGSATVSVTGGTPGYTYSWSPSGGTSSFITNRPAGNYTCTIKDLNNCSKTQTVSITQPAVISSVVSQTQAACGGLSTGSVTLSLIGGTTPYTFSWSPSGGNAYIASSLAAGSYTCYITDVNGCAKTQTATISSIATPTVSVSNLTLCSVASGTLNASGATTYSWNTGATTSTLSVPFTNATYTVNGYNGSCVNTKTVSVTATNNPTVAVTNLTLCSSSMGTLSATGATTYSWNTGATTSTLSVPASNSTYTVYGYNGSCVNTKTVSVSVTPGPTVTVNNANVCTGNTALLSASGATTYSWSTNATTSTISVTPSVTTIYTVTGYIGSCSNTKTVSVNVIPVPSLTITASSYSVCSGSPVTLSVTGSTNLFWSSGASSPVITVTPTTANSSYTVNGFDPSYTCSDLETISISVITPTVIVNDQNICSGNSATITASGASSYSWTSGPNSASITVSPNTTTVYTVTGTSLCGSVTKTVSVNVTPTPTVAVTNLSLCSGSNGTLSATGATTYSWNTGATTSTLSVPASNTTYTVYGYNGSCVDTKIVSVSVTNTPTLAVSNVTVCSGYTGIVSATGATTYSWNTGATTSTISVPSSNGTYTVSGYNGSCVDTKTVDVLVLASPSLTVSNVTICAGGTATLIAGGANTYYWTTGDFTSFIVVNPNSTTTYSVFGYGSNGCMTTEIVTVTVNSLPIVILGTISSPLCVNNAAITLSGSPVGGIYSGAGVSGSNFDPFVSGVGTFTVTYDYTDVNLCSASDTKTVNVSLCTSLTEALQVNEVAINIYPNPNSGEFTISFPAKGNYTIINALGQTIQFIDLKEDAQSVQINGLSHGIYYLLGKSSKAKIVVTK